MSTAKVNVKCDNQHTAAYSGSIAPRRTVLEDLYSFFSKHASELACFCFVIVASIYHLWPSLTIGAAVLLVTIVLVVKYPALLIWIITYGYLVHTILVPDDTRIVFSIPIVLSLFIWTKRSFDGNSRLVVKPTVLVLCGALSMVILISEIADPAIGRGEGLFITRLIDIAMCLLITRTIKSEHELRLCILALSVSAIALALYFCRYAIVNNISSLYHLIRVELKYADPNYVSLFMCIGLGPLFAISASRATKSWMSRVLSLVFGSVVSCGVLLTTSRMGSLLLGINLGIAIMSFYKSRFVSLLVLLVSALAFIFIVLPQLETIPEFSELHKRWTSADALGGGGREALVKNSLEGFSRASAVQALFGRGTQANYIVLNGANTHNSYLEFLLDHGIVGMGLLIALHYVALLNIFSTKSPLIATSMLTIWVTLVVASFALSPFVNSWGWAALAPLLVSPATPTRMTMGV